MKEKSNYLISTNCGSKIRILRGNETNCDKFFEKMHCTGLARKPVKSGQNALCRISMKVLESGALP